MMNPLCFVLMPFGKKPSNVCSIIDFDSIYQDLVAPAINEAQLEPLRADEEMTGGIIHKPMFERLILCEYAVADLTTANANVFYELGVRHAVRPQSTVLLFAKDSGQLPFDIAPLRAMPYQLTTEGKTANTEITKMELVKRLEDAKVAQNSAIDSPIFQLVEGFPEIDHTKTDVFRDRVQYSAKVKEQIAAARKQGIEALLSLEKQLGDIRNLESGVLIDLFLSYRAVEGWREIINLVQKMSPALANTVMVQEQLALALNRDGKGEDAESVLLDLIKKRGPSSETYGILGRVYKDRWEVTYKSGDELLAAGLLDQAIEAYLHGFEADWRDAYPGVNAVTLMEIREPPDPRRTKLIPVVEYAVDRRIATGKPDYWDYATRLELAVLAKDQDTAIKSTSNALALLREPWEAETTVRNLRLIREARERRKDTVEWTKQIEQSLEKRSKSN
ncbi:MAG TPA: TRAFs-binding domain-containing protein [Nitrososphaeraceae archaeon]|nr:TRAFs-binding domain-containing protein [Nitrososphaeraceae archaeon]